jgi:hypothetical protein
MAFKLKQIDRLGTSVGRYWKQDYRLQLHCRGPIKPLRVVLLCFHYLDYTASAIGSRKIVNLKEAFMSCDILKSARRDQ